MVSISNVIIRLNIFLPSANAIIYPGTMVIKSINALMTSITVSAYINNE